MNTWLLCVAVGLQAGYGGLNLAGGEAVQQKKKGPTQLQFEIDPPSVIIHVDKKRVGKAGKVKRYKCRPGRHVIRLVNNKDEVEFEMRVAKHETMVVKYAFEDSGVPNTSRSEESPEAQPEAKPDQPEEKPDRDEAPPKERPKKRYSDEPDDPYGDIPE